MEQLLDAGIEFIEIGDHRYAGLARPTSRKSGCGGVVAVDVEDPRIRDPLAMEIAGLQYKALISPAENGTFSLSVDEDERLRAGSSGNGNEPGFDSGVG